MDTEICLEGHDGSPLDSKLIASTKPWKPSDLLTANNVVVGGEMAVIELDMFQEESEEATAFVSIGLALIEQA